MAEEMTHTGIGLGDAMIMARQGNCDNNGWGGAWNNPFMYLIWLAMFGGYGGGFFGNRAAAADAVTNASLQNAVYASNDNQTLQAMIRNIGNGLADSGYALNNAIKDSGYANVTATKDVGCNLGTAIANSSYATNDAIKDAAATNRAAVQAGFTNLAQDVAAGFVNTNQNMVAGFNAVNNNLTEGRFGMQAGFTGIGSKIDELKYAEAQNTCVLKTAMHEEGEATRALIQANTMQALRDKLAEQGASLQAAKFQISQYEQNATLINALKNGCACGCGCV